MYVDEIIKPNMSEIADLGFGPNGDPLCDYCGTETAEEDLMVWVYTQSMGYGSRLLGPRYFGTPKCSVECEREGSDGIEGIDF